MVTSSGGDITAFEGERQTTIAVGDIGIQNAEVGHSTAGVEQLKEDIHTIVFGQIIDRIDEAEAKLETTIDQIWHGNSADQFKVNMKNDTTVLKDAIQSLEYSLNTELTAIDNYMKDVDNNLVKERTE